MLRGRKPFPRWTVKPTDGSHDGILVAAKNGEEAIEKAREMMQWYGLVTATEQYKY